MTTTMTGAETAGPRGAEVTTEFGTGSGIDPREEEVAATEMASAEPEFSGKPASEEAAAVAPAWAAERRAREEGGAAAARGPAAPGADALQGARGPDRRGRGLPSRTFCSCCRCLPSPHSALLQVRK